MPTIQPPPIPQKTGNQQVDAYLERLYRWAYLFWFYGTEGGTRITFATVERVVMLDSGGGDGGDGGGMDSFGWMIPGPKGEQGERGLFMPGMDGEDAEEWPVPALVRAPDSDRLQDATWAAPKPIGNGTAAAGTFTTVTATGGFGCNAASAQTAYASGGALNAYGAGANGFDTAGNASALHAMVVSIRAALVANGIMS